MDGTATWLTHPGVDPSSFRWGVNPSSARRAPAGPEDQAGARERHGLHGRLCPPIGVDG